MIYHCMRKECVFSHEWKLRDDYDGLCQADGQPTNDGDPCHCPDKRLDALIEQGGAELKAKVVGQYIERVNIRAKSATGLADESDQARGRLALIVLRELEAEAEKGKVE